MFDCYPGSIQASHQNYYRHVERPLMTPKITTHQYTECGLPNIWIRGLSIQDDAGEKTIRIPGIRKLHALISTAVVQSDGTLTGSELRYLRTEMGMTQTQLGELVHRDRLTVSHWEKDESTLDGATEAYIRILASKKLNLGDVDPEEVSRKCKLTAKNKKCIHIEKRTNSENYRLAA